MFISVVCPTYNSESFVKKTLLSVLKQTRLPDEIIVADDGSRDRTVEVVENVFACYSHVKTRIIKNRHRGPGATRNIALQNVSQKDWVAFIDSDDLWKPEKLAFLERKVNIDKNQYNFYCHNEIKFQNKIESLLNYAVYYDESLPFQIQLFLRNFISTSAVLCRYELLADVSFFDEHLQSSQDYDLWLKLVSHLRPYFIFDPLGVYVVRKGNITATARYKRYCDLMRVICRHRAKVTIFTFLCRIAKVHVSFLRQYLCI